MVSGRSAARATWYGLPLSSDSNCASSSACFSIRSASLFINTPRSAALILRHGPLSNAALAAATALSTSGASDSATCVITSPVDGLIVGNVFPDTLSTHFPLISSFVGPILTFDSNTAAAVAIFDSSSLLAAPKAKSRRSDSLRGVLPVSLVEAALQVGSSQRVRAFSPFAVVVAGLRPVPFRNGKCGARPLKPRQAQARCRERSLYLREVGRKVISLCSDGLQPGSFRFLWHSHSWLCTSLWGSRAHSS